MKKDAHFRSPSRFRVVGRFGVLFLAMAATGAHADTSDCDGMSRTQQTQCERVMDCMALEDRDVRRACISAVQRAGGQTRNESEDRAASPLEAARSVVVNSPRRAGKRDVQTVEERLDALEEQLAEPGGTADTGTYPPPPPPEFTGELTDIYGSVMGRRLLTIDNQYLFESERAKRGRFKVGQTVQARQSRSMMGKRAWVLTGPVGGSVQALRIRCEHEDLGRDDRRRCAGMLNP